MSIRFSGLKPPGFDVPVIELETVGGSSVDLYNDCSLKAVMLEGSTLSFEFLTSTGGRVRVSFREIRDLRVDQPADWAPGEADQIDHLLIRREGPWRQVVFKAGGLTYEFDAQEVSLRYK